MSEQTQKHKQRHRLHHEANRFALRLLEFLSTAAEETGEEPELIGVAEHPYQPGVYAARYRLNPRVHLVVIFEVPRRRILSVHCELELDVEEIKSLLKSLAEAIMKDKTARELLEKVVEKALDLFLKHCTALWLIEEDEVKRGGRVVVPVPHLWWSWRDIAREIWERAHLSGEVRTEEESRMLDLALRLCEELIKHLHRVAEEHAKPYRRLLGEHTRREQEVERRQVLKI